MNVVDSRFCHHYFFLRNSDAKIYFYNLILSSCSYWKNWTNLLKRNFDFEISFFLFWDVLITKSIEDLLCFYMSKSSFRYIHSFFGFDCLTKATGHFGAVKIFEKYFRSNRFLMLGYNRVCNSTHRELTRTMLTAKFKLYKL